MVAWADRTMVVSTTTGSGTLTLGSAITGYQDFTNIGNNNTVDYTIEAVDSNGIPTGDWEVGQGTFTLSGTTLSRTTIYASSNGGSAVSFGAGNKRVFCSPPATWVANNAQLNLVNTFVPPVRTSGSARYFAIQTPADTTLTASAESIGIQFGGNSSSPPTTVIRQWSTGALTTQREYLFVAPTLAFAGASVVTTAATVTIDAAPIAGTNATLTNKYALWVQGGNSRYEGNIIMRGGTAFDLMTLSTTGLVGINGFAFNGGSITSDAGNSVTVTTGTGFIIKNAAGFTAAPLQVTPVARTTGSPSCFVLTTPADTTLTATVESISVNLNCSATRQFSTGALTTQRECVIQAPTYAFVGASTVTNAATLAITGAPKTGTNATHTNTHGLLIQAGAVTSAGAAYGLTCNTPTGGTLNYAAQFIGGTVNVSEGLSTSFAKVGGSIFDHFADVSTTHTDGTFDTIYSDTIPASSLGTNGDKITAVYNLVTVANATATREIKLAFAGTTIYDSTAQATTSIANISIRAEIIRVSSTVVRCNVSFTDNLNLATYPGAQYTEITSLTLSGTNALALTAAAASTGAASADIVGKLAIVEWKSAA